MVKDTAKEYGSKGWQLLRYGRILPDDPFSDAVASLQKNLNIRRTAKAYTFRIEALDSDPKWAVAIVDEAAKTLSAILHTEQIRLARETRESLGARLKENDKEITELRTMLDSFKVNSKVASLSEQLSLKLKTVASFQEEYARAQNELQGLLRKRAEIDQQLNSQDRSITYDSTSTENPVAEEMRLELAKLEVERSGLLGKYTEEHQTVKAVDARIAQVQRKLQTEAKTVVSSESVRSNDIYQKLLSERMTADANIQALTALIKAYDSSIGQESGLARNLTSKEQQLADLSLRLAAAERSYNMITTAYEEARIAETRVASEVAILHKAYLPTAPVKPIKILHVGISAALSLVLAIGLTFLFNFFDTSIRGVEQIERVLRIPVLATIPATHAIAQGDGRFLLERNVAHVRHAAPDRAESS
jgi:polysaccharide biosynthesis transport protein